MLDRSKLPELTGTKNAGHDTSIKFAKPHGFSSFFQMPAT